MADSIIGKILNAKKIIAYVVGVLAQLIALGVDLGPAQPYVVGVVAVATGVGIYVAQNVPLDDVGSHGA